MAKVITFKDPTGYEFEMEDEDTLVIRVNLAQSNGVTGGGKRRIATTHGPLQMVAGEHKVTMNFNSYAS